MTGIVHPITKMQRLTFWSFRCTMVSEDLDPAPVPRHTILASPALRLRERLGTERDLMTQIIDCQPLGD